MNNKRNMILGLGSLALILGVGGAMATTANAYKGDQQLRVQIIQ